MSPRFPRLFYPLAIVLGLIAGSLIGAAVLRLSGSSFDQLFFQARHWLERDAAPAVSQKPGPASAAQVPVEKVTTQQAPADKAAARPRKNQQISSDDPELGWVPVPDAAVPFSTDEFTITYVMDGAGARLVPGAVPGRPLILTLGGSFTFGHGVENAETWPSVLQEFVPDFTIRNRSANAWGTAQCMVALRRDLEGGEPIAAAIYGFPMFHLSRNYRSRSWLEVVDQAGRRIPLFAVDSGRPIFQQLIGLEQALDDRTPGLRQTEWEIFEVLMREITSMTDANGTRFVFVLLPWIQRYGSALQRDHERLLRFLKAEEIEFVDLLRHPELIQADNYYVKDRHPRPQWHRRVAEILAESAALEFARPTNSR